MINNQHLWEELVNHHPHSLVLKVQINWEVSWGKLFHLWDKRDKSRLRNWNNGKRGTIWVINVNLIIKFWKQISQDLHTLYFLYLIFFLLYYLLFSYFSFKINIMQGLALTTCTSLPANPIWNLKLVSAIFLKFIIHLI